MERLGAYKEDVLSVLLDMSDEAVLSFDAEGTVRFANERAEHLLGCVGLRLDGMDIKDLFYAGDMSRPAAGELPFSTTGEVCLVMAKLVDGSFIPAQVRCRRIGDSDGFLLIAEDVDSIHETRREQGRLLAELRRSNERLRGVLSIISTATLSGVGFEEFATHISTELQHVFEADAVLLYLAEGAGFRVYGRSEGFDRLGISQTFVPHGMGLPSLVSRTRRSMRLQLVSLTDDAAVMVDMDTDTRVRLHSELAQMCSTMVGTPVFSYDRVMAVIAVCWAGPYPVDRDGLSLLDTVGDFLSIEFATAISQMQQMRESELSALLSEVRDAVRTAGSMNYSFASAIARRVAQVVPAHVLEVQDNPWTKTVTVHLPAEDESGPRALPAAGAYGLEGLNTVEFPYAFDDIFPEGATSHEILPNDLVGMWVGRHTDLAFGMAVRITSPHSSGDVAQRALLFLRGPFDPPFDEVEVDFLTRLGAEVSRALDVERERANETQIAQALQSGLRNQLPEVPGITTASLYLSATASAVVGGDFFDLYPLPDDHVVVVIGDVSGKGVEAAAMASLVKTALTAYAWDHLDPASMLCSLNNLFVNFSRLETFASLFVASLDLRAGVATYCSGGHPPTMHVRDPLGDAPSLELLTVQSPIIGAQEDLDYTNGTFQIDEGDLLFLYTDGTTEARSPDGDFFGEEALRETLLRCCHLDVSELPGAVLSEVTDFAGGALHDDVAMVALRVDRVGEDPVEVVPEGEEEGAEVGEAAEPVAPGGPEEAAESVAPDGPERAAGEDAALARVPAGVTALAPASRNETLHEGKEADHGGSHDR